MTPIHERAVRSIGLLTDELQRSAAALRAKPSSNLRRLLRASGAMDWNEAPDAQADSDRIAAEFGVQPRWSNSFFVRDLTVGTSSAGGYLVGPREEAAAGVPNAPNDFLSWCTVVDAAAPSGQQQVGRFDALPTVTVLANEGASITEQTPATSNSLLAPAHMTTYVEHSRQWALQTERGANALARLITNALRKKLMQQIIDGSGSSGEVLGLVNDSAVSGAAGTTLAQTHIVAALEAVETSAGDGPLGWVVTPAAAKILRQRAEISGGEAILRDGKIGGYPAIVCGGSANAHAIFGRWQDLIVYQWAPLELAVHPFANFPSAIIGVRGWLTANAAPMVNGSFYKISSLT